MSDSPATTGDAALPWRRLSARVIWVDLAQSALSLVPALIAVLVVGADWSFAELWPVLLVAVLGITGAVADMVRWLCTSYRVTATDVERRTGVLVRKHRSVRRDRIRSVDTHAQLRHRLAGLRVVTVGAGQQTGAGEAALLLDALSKQDAARLRRELLAGDSRAAAQPVDAAAESEAGEGPADERDVEVLATFRPWWVVYNMFGIWAYVMAAGLLWGLFWLASSFGIDIVGPLLRAADWQGLGWLGVALVVVVVGGVVGAIGMGVHFLASHWGFELARVRSGEKTYLRTRRGLFSTREVSRDESRMRGLSIDEPLLWRWIGMADTNVITTGLSVWSAEQPTAILPRGPIRVAREVAKRVMGSDSPLEVPLRRHPRAALRRRLWWATLAAGAPMAVVAVPASTGAVPAWLLWAGIALWPIALLLAVIAYRALGHAITDDYLVVRSGLMTRSTAALRRDAVSTIAVRRSLLQRRLGLSTVSAMTAAGWGSYEAPDLAAADAVAFAASAAPGLLDEFIATAPGSEDGEHASTGG